MTKHVAVIMGGWSEEREVSLVSGEACATGLEEAGYDVTRIDLTRDLRETLQALDPKPDVVFNALHGRYGEDGTIQAVLDLLQIPYTHSGLLASAVAMDKPMALRLFRAAGIPTAEGVILAPEDLGNGDPMARPYVVKPAREGSSVGVYIVQEGDNGPDYSGWSFGDALVEEYVPGMELTVSVMGDRALAVTELKPNDGFYDYEAKYTDGKTVHLCPAPLPEELAAQMMDYAVRAHRILGCRGVSRADFRYDPATEKLIIMEVNTQPGMTPLSLVPEQAAYKGISFPNLMAWMVENAACDG